MSMIINTTPHPITILDDNNSVIKVFPKGEFTIRLASSTVDAGFQVEGINITTTKYGEVTGLPEYHPFVYYIVSGMVKAALPLRTDLLVPGEQVRDSNGMIIGCKSLGI